MVAPRPWNRIPDPVSEIPEEDAIYMEMDSPDPPTPPNLSTLPSPTSPDPRSYTSPEKGLLSPRSPMKFLHLTGEGEVKGPGVRAPSVVISPPPELGYLCSILVL